MSRAAALAVAFLAVGAAPAADYTARFVSTNAFCVDYDDENECCLIYEGHWTNSLVWDIGQVPNNVGGDVFDVIWEGELGPCDPQCVLIQDLGTNVSIRDFTFAASGQFGGCLAIEGNLDWSQGTIVGQIAVQGTATLHATPPEALVLGESRLALGGASTLACGVDGGGFSFGGWPLTWVINAPGATLSVLDGAGLTNGIEFQNYGTCRIEPSAGEFPVDLIYNHGTLVLNNRTLRLKMQPTGSGGTLHQHAGTLQLNGGRIVGELVVIEGGWLRGQGEVEEASVWSTAEGLAGQITFNQLSVDGLAVTLGGSAPGEYDQFTIRQLVSLGGALQITFTNGFETRIGSGDAIEVFKLEGGATTWGQFSNVQLGQRVSTADGRGSFLWSNRGGALALTDFAPPGPRLEFTSGSMTYPFPPTPCYLASGATLSAGADTVWAGGGLTARISAGFDAAQDHLQIASQGDAPGQIRVSWSDADNGEVFFSGAEFATVRRPTAAEIVFDFEPSATTTAVQALLRQLLYTNRVFSADAFTGPSVSFPARTAQLTLTDGAGHLAIVSRQIEFPALTSLCLGVGGIPRCPPVTPLPGDTTLDLYLCRLLRPSVCIHPRQVAVSVMGRFSPSGEFRSLPRWLTSWSLRDALDLHCNCDPSNGNFSLEVDPGFPGTVTVTAQSSGKCALLTVIGTENFYLNLIVPASSTWVCTFSSLVEYFMCLAFPGLCSGTPQPALKGPNPEPPPVFSLATFRALESLMNQTDEGRRLAALYWQHGPEMVRILQADTNVVLQLGSVVTNFQPLVAALLSGQGQRGQISQALIDELNAAYLTLTNYASPELRTALETERARFHGFQDFVGQDFSRWAQRLQIPAPTNAWMHISSVGFSNGQLSLEANAVEGWNVSLWRASDLTLKNWEPVPGTRLETNGYTLRLTDTNPPPPQRFYQLRAQP